MTIGGSTITAFNDSRSWAHYLLGFAAGLGGPLWFVLISFGASVYAAGLPDRGPAIAAGDLVEFGAGVATAWVVRRA